MIIKKKSHLWMKKTLLMFAVFFGLLSVNQAVSSEVSQDQEVNQNSEIDSTALEVNDLANANKVTTSEQNQKAKSSDDVVFELIEAYKTANNISEGYNVNADKSFSSAIAMVALNTAHPEFGKARAVAFEDAFNKALTDYVKSQNNSVMAEAIGKLYSDSSTNAKEFTEELSKGQTKEGALIDKLIAVGDAVTSNKLRDLGINPDDYNSAPADKKKKLLEDVLVKKITEKFSKSMGGVTPIQTFIGEDGNGNQSVGVIVMYSSKLEAVADALKRGQKPAIVKTGPALNQIIPNDPTKLYDLLGVRVLFDENGLVVVSYGQWSNSYKGDNVQMRSRHTDVAFKQAESIANAQISEFLNSSFSGEVQSETGKEVEQSIIKSGKTGLTSESVTTNMVDIRKEMTKRKTSSLLQGASTFKRWKYETKDGHEIVGVIKVYSFANIQAAQSVKAKSVQPSSKGKASGRAAEEQMDINTF